ncbi:MAG: hypothetical protein ACP5N7_02010 [Candidatus Pacearchaeota archaeon]
MSSISLDRLLFDSNAPTEGPLVGSYQIGKTGAVITSTLVSGKEGLDVNVINASIPVTQSGTWAVQITDGTDTLAIDASGYIGVNVQNASIAVTATDLDIRDLTHVSDSIKIGDGTDFLAVNADGSINVVSSDYVPNGAILATAVSADDTAAKPLPATALTARRVIDVQNRGPHSIFVGGSAVSTTSGVEISKGGNKEFEVGPSQIVYAICATGKTADVRVLERA